MYVGVKGKISDPEQTTEGWLSKKRKLPAKQNVFPKPIKKPKPFVKKRADCPRADNTLLLLRKIQQLEKQGRPFDLYSAGAKNRLVLSDDPNDPCCISYDSKGPVKELNGAAKNRTDGKSISCQHLAYAFATGGFGCKANVSQGKEPGSKFSTVASVDNIRNNAAIKTDRQLKNTPIRSGIPKVAVYFDAEHFGQALYGVWMNKSDQTTHNKPLQTWLVGSENHLMAVNLLPTAESAMKIEWYDPNSTTIVRRAMVLNEETLQQLTLNQFVCEARQKYYALDQGQAGVMMSTDAVEAQKDSDATVLSALTPSLLYLLMLHGQLNKSVMDSLKMTLSEVRRNNQCDLTELLAAKRIDGLPGLYMALQCGHHETVSTFLGFIRQYGHIIEPRVLWELLAAKRWDGLPGLFMALQKGHQKAVSRYVEGISQLRDMLEADVIKKLLAAKTEDGLPGLFTALENGHHKAVSAYFEGITQLRDSIEPEAIKELLAAKHGDGTPGLFMALQEGHHKVVSAYLEGIKQLRGIIDPEAIRELLAAKDEDGTPGLFMALQEGHQEAVSAYVEGIGDIVEPEAIKELLAALGQNP